MQNDEQQQLPPGVLPHAEMIVYVEGAPVSVRREGAQLYIEDIPARILAIEERAVRLAYETEEGPGRRLQPRDLLLSGEQFYQLVYGQQPPDPARVGVLEAELELRAQAQAPTILPALTQAALAQMLRSLPVPVEIFRHENRYSWQCLQGGGSADTFIDAMREALTYLEAAKLQQ